MDEQDKVPFTVGQPTQAAVQADAVSKLVWTQEYVQSGGSQKYGGAKNVHPSFEWDVFRQVIREARLFVMGSPVLLNVYNNARQMVVEHLGAPDVIEAPTILPFETIFLTTDDSNGECLTMNVGSIVTEITGFVLTIRGGVFRAWMILRDRTELTPMWIAARTNGSWHGSDHLSCLVIHQLCDVVNHQPRVTTPLTFAARREWKRRAPAGTFPQPYYVIKFQSLVTHSSKGTPPTEGRKHASPGYRFDSRSHRRLLLYRGPLPIKASDQAALTARGYQVFEDVVPEKWREAMEHRGHAAQKPSEWIAVRYTHVRQSVKGAAHLPYLPSIHSIGSRDES